MTSNKSNFRATSWLNNAIFFTVLLSVVFLHSYKLDTIPLGLFFDESTIGIHASDIVKTRFDNYNNQPPIYFKSEFDYDSPILIYTTALFFKIFGISEYTLRLPNVFFFVIALISTVLLVNKIFNGNKVVQIYLLIAYGFLPQFFTFSRLSFEVISQLAFVSLAFLCIWYTFHQPDFSRTNGYLKALICGVIIGISTYTYSTASLLSAMLMVSTLILYRDRKNWVKLLILIASCLIALIPYIFFSLTNPGALTFRFHEISFIYQTIPLIEKIKIFFINYFSNWSLKFLIFHGDMNLRHSTGIGGMVFISVFLLFILGLINISFTKKWNNFSILLLVNLFFTPAASALTSEGNPHAIRSLLMGYFITLLSSYGLSYLLALKNKQVRNILVIATFITTSYESYRYQFDYFFHYPARSVEDFGSFNLYGALEFAIEHSPNEIILFDNYTGGMDTLILYSRIIDTPENILISASSHPTPKVGSCIIYRRLTDAEAELNNSTLSFEEFRSRYRPSDTERKFGVEAFSGLIKARCYSD